MKKRFMVAVNDKELWIQEQSFVILTKLAVAAKTTTDGWTGALQAAGTDYHVAFHRLREDLQPSGENAEFLVENDEAKQYRLSVPPANITINMKDCTHAVPGLSDVLEPLLDKEAE